MLVDGIDECAGNIGTVALIDKANALIDSRFERELRFLRAALAVERDDFEPGAAEHAAARIDGIGGKLCVAHHGLADVRKRPRQRIDDRNLDAFRCER